MIDVQIVDNPSSPFTSGQFTAGMINIDDPDTLLVLQEMIACKLQAVLAKRTAEAAENNLAEGS
jgi:hypothetical protein